MEIRSAKFQYFGGALFLLKSVFLNSNSIWKLKATSVTLVKALKCELTVFRFQFNVNQVLCYESRSWPVSAHPVLGLTAHLPDLTLLC